MILCDTNVLVAAAQRDDLYHSQCANLITEMPRRGETLLIPATVIAEIAHLLGKKSAAVEATVLRTIARKPFELVNLVPDDLVRMAELVTKYDRENIGATDASLVALSERLGVTQIATVDRRDFFIMSTEQRPLTLLPENLPPPAHARVRGASR